MLRSLLFGICLCLWSSLVWAQEVREIEVRGNQRLGDQAVLQYIGSQVGVELSRTQVRDDLRALFNTGLFADVRIDVESTTGGVRLVVVVEERDYIQEIAFDGNEGISDEDLRKAADLRLPLLWDEVTVRQAADRLRRLYRDKGFYLVTLRSQVEQEGSRRRLVFFIDEGTRVQVRRIYFQGNEFLVDERLRDAMITKEGGFWQGISRRGHFDEDLLVQVDTRRIQLEYLRRGFAFVRVEPPSISFTPDRSSVIASYQITEGQRYRIGRISFSGDLDFIGDPEKLRRDLSTETGKWWNILAIQEDIQKIQDIYGNEGFAYANVSPTWDIDAEDDELLNIDFRVDKGSIVHFGRVEIVGNLETLDRVIRRELEFAEGELFHIGRFRRSRENLMRLGYFSDVNFTQRDRLADQKMDISIEVQEQSTGSLTVGASFSSFDSFGFQGSASKVNLFGRGYDISASASISSRRQLFSAFFRNPRVYDSRFSLTTQAFRTEIQSLDETRIREWGGSVGVGYPLSRDWRVGGTYGFRKIGINIRDTIKKFYPDSFGFNSSLAFSISRDTLNVREIFLPTSGSLNELSATVASRYLGSQLSYVQLNYTGKKYWQVFDPEMPLVGGSVLSAGLRLDYIRGIEGRSTPFNERFVPGGIMSIRGHPFRTLGPCRPVAFSSTGRRSDDGEYGLGFVEDLCLGGNKQVVFNVEYLFDLFAEARIKGVLFFDIGNTFPEGDYDFLRLRKSAGFGFRWFSPFGPLRFEWGIPLDRKPGEDSLLFDFSIGAPF
ncbi:MAG: outer membrane protein assembly factor BamA [Bradymonadales bacterium]|nr:MAG: outer membrane protein assembly factor BamA [Bradymonadales bacterium]